MADAIHTAGGAGDVQLLTGAGKLVGFSAHESAAVGTATSFTLRDGTSTAGKALAFAELLADGDKNISFAHPVEFTTGLFLDRAATGESEITVFLA